MDKVASVSFAALWRLLVRLLLGVKGGNTSRSKRYSRWRRVKRSCFDLALRASLIELTSKLFFFFVAHAVYARHAESMDFVLGFVAGVLT